MSANTPTERYVHEVARRIPADQREDVADELRTTIADTVEAREAADPDSAEREVLTEMGDPIRLAARYSGRPLSLIGPDLYPTYIRLLGLLLTTVLPVVTAVLVVIDILENDDVGSAIGSAIGAVFTVGAQMIAWVTVGFALAERFRHQKGATGETDTWTPDDLPEPRQHDKHATASCTRAAWYGLLIGLICWQHVAKPYRAGGPERDGDRLQVLDASLWSGWIWPILAGLAALTALELLRFTARAWTIRLACCYAVAEAVFTLPLAWILYDRRFFDPDFLADVNGDWSTPDSLYTVAALSVLATGGSRVVKLFREARG